MSETSSISWIKWLVISLVVLVLDQWSKQWILASLTLTEHIELFPFFNIIHVHNYGAAFSILSDQPGWQRWFLTIVTSVISIVLLVWLRRLKASQKLLAFSLVFIIGGALGNLYDRVMYGYVVDFIDWHYNGYHWPAFNLADAAICLGAVLLIVDTFKNPDLTKESNS